MNAFFLKKLLNQNSYSLNKKGVDTKMQMIFDQLKDLPLDFETVKHNTYGDFGIIRCEKNNPDLPKIGLSVHIDTVHLETSSFKTEEKGDTLYGQGAMDMQGSIFVVIEALKKLHQQSQLTNLVFILNTCEEQGSPAFQKETKQLAQELDYLLVLEASGNGNLDPNDKNFAKDFHLVTERKGILQYTIKCTGPGGHSGVLAKKEQRSNAISQAIAMMQAIDDLADYEQGTTINLEHVKGGQKTTIIARDCEFTFDVRFAFQSEKERIEKAITEIAATQYIPGVTVEEPVANISLQPMEPTESVQEFFTQVKNIGEEYGFTISQEKRGGWSDASNFLHYNPNLKVLDGFGPKGEGEHTDGEFVWVKTVESAVELVTHVVEKLCKR